MPDPRRFSKVRSISFDFDGVLSTLVLGRRWAKTRARRPPNPIIAEVARALRTGLNGLTQGLRKPYPDAEDVLRGLRSSGRILYLLTSLTAERIAGAERWLDRYGWRGFFDRLFFNTAGKDADDFKEAILQAHPVDVHVDDDPQTITRLSPLFPDMIFIHLDHRGRGGAEGVNVVVAQGWEDLSGLFLVGPGARADGLRPGSPGRA